MLLFGAGKCEKQQSKLVEWKAFVDTMSIKSADLKTKYFVLEFCGFQGILGVGKGFSV